MSDVLTNTRHIYDLVELCAQKGVTHAVLSPGSRCAPLLIGFGKHSKITTISVTDERSAAFIGMGIAQQTTSPVVLVCTSGTAGQNYAPAVTEAFYQNVPLIVLTADRPAEWIDQWDGQTIHQQNLYVDHIKASMEFVAGRPSLQKAARLLDQAIEPAPAPVHINIPISKPFYPLTEDDIPVSNMTLTEAVHNQNKPEKRDYQQLQSLLKSSNKILIMAGQQPRNNELNQLLNKTGIPVMGDITSNMEAIERTEIFYNTDDKALAPDLLISIGHSVISEKQKHYYRNNKPANHWHIGRGMVGDPFQSLSKSIAMEPLDFFKLWLAENWQSQPQQAYKKMLEKRSDVARLHVMSGCENQRSFNQYTATKKLLESLPENSVLHLANSMTVRVANSIGLRRNVQKSNLPIWSNRGTSGIDGCVSTAVGHAIAAANKTQVLVIGDLAFLYDRNGLWLNHPFPENLKIIVMNNNGGGIFKLIPGPTNQGQLESLFSTPHTRTARLTAEEFNLDYQTASTFEELQSALDQLTIKGSAILEIFTDMQLNQQVFDKLSAQP